MKQKGFTLIELLATIVILGIIFGVAVVSITKYIDNSRRKMYVQVAHSYIDEVRNQVNAGTYSFKNISSVYYIPLSCISLEKGGKSPYGEFEKGYVVLTFDGEKENYYFYARDVEGFGIENVKEEDISVSSIKANASEVKYKLIDDREVIESMNENTCSTSLVMQDIPISEDKCFKVEGNTIIDYDSSLDDCGVVVSIPKEIDGKKIEKIGDNAFSNKDLTVVVIPDSIKEIGQDAFSYNRLTNLEIGDNVKIIGQGAFSNNNLTNLKLGSGITMIESGVFSNNLLTQVTLPYQITKIGDNAFQQNNLKNIVLPENLLSIGIKAFRGNQLESLTIPNSVTSIAGGAFNDNQLADKDAFIYDRDENGNIDYSTIISYGGKEREKVVVPSKVNGVSIKKLGYRSFRGCMIKNIVLPDTIEELEELSLYGNSLTNIKLPKNLKKIGGYALGFNSFTKLEIPNGVLELDDMFVAENKIELITIPNSIKSISSSAFVEKDDFTVGEIRIDKKKGELAGHPFGLKKDFDRIVYLR